jgi:acetylornithine/N-succinyldiaminopimelate aminotransferase
MAIGNAVLDVVLADGFLDSVERIAAILRSRLAALVAKYPQVFAEVRGAGLLLGLRCVVTNTEVIDRARAKGLLSVGAGDNVVRLMPPLIIDEAIVDEAVGILDAVGASFSK